MKNPGPSTLFSRKDHCSPALSCFGKNILFCSSPDPLYPFLLCTAVCKCFSINQLPQPQVFPIPLSDPRCLPLLLRLGAETSRPAMPGREASLELPCSKGIIKKCHCATQPYSRNTIPVMIISIPSSLNQGSLRQKKNLELNSSCLQEARAQCLGLYQCSRRCCCCLRLQNIDGWRAPEISQGRFGGNFPHF